MADFSEEASLEYWASYQDPSIYRVIAFMEGVETWTMDGDEVVEDAITRLGDGLEKLKDIEPGAEDAFIKVCAYIKTARCLRILQHVDTSHPGCASKIIMHAEETSQHNQDVSGLFLRRNMVFERLRLLGRIFSEERMQFVLKALEDDE